MASVSRIPATAGLLLALAAMLASQPPREQPGLLPTGWRITPAGKQVPLDAMPISSALSRDGRHLFIANGQLTHIDAASGSVVAKIPSPGVTGLVMSPAGDRLYAGGGAQAAVIEFAFAAGKLAPARTFALAGAFVGDVAISPDGRMVYATDRYRDSVIVINPQSGLAIQRIKTGRRPHRILFHPDGKSFFVTHWADGSMGQYDAATGSSIGTVRLGAHPTDMVWRAGGPADSEAGQAAWAGRVFVAASHTNTVYTVAVTEAKALRVLESINVAMTQRQPVGMMPAGLALSPDRNRLYVACPGANAAAVVDVSSDRSFVEGFIPTGEFPSAVRVPASGTLVVLSKGSSSWIDPFTPAQLDAWTKAVAANSPYRDAKLDEPSPLPAVQHVIYIMKDGAPGPNHQRFAREFVQLDNFHTLGDSAASNYFWSTAAIVPDFPQDPLYNPPAGYLWTNAAVAGLSLRNFGHLVSNRSNPQPGETQVASVRDPVLAKVTNLNYRGLDPNYPDADRAKVFLAELAGNLPRLTLIRLDSDDAALGMIVDGIANSRFWKSAVICVLDGRSALLISPFVKPRTVDSSMYNTLSMLRTVELLLGLRPMTHFDAGARPMTASFQARAQ